jgi:hypothetical protein
MLEKVLYNIYRYDEIASHIVIHFTKKSRKYFFNLVAWPDHVVIFTQNPIPNYAMSPFFGDKN